jgi:DnaK suppressor protein
VAPHQVGGAGMAAGGLGFPARKGGRSRMTLDGTAPLDAVPMSDIISADYRPSEDEPYMNARQSEYFRRKLLRWRDDILRGSDVTLRQLREEDMRLPDQSDWASAEIQRSFELRTRDRERKLLSKIDAALKRIEDGSYGYCEETQEPIGLKRLEARPIATLTIEAQERHERRERAYRED